MLFPALYLQAKNGPGIYEKQGFDLVRGDFQPNTWRIMDEVFAIRENWDYALPYYRKRLISRTLATRPFIARRFSAGIPTSLRARLRGDFFSDIARLVCLMQNKIA